MDRAMARTVNWRRECVIRQISCLTRRIVDGVGEDHILVDVEDVDPFRRRVEGTAVKASAMDVISLHFVRRRITHGSASLTMRCRRTQESVPLLLVSHWTRQI